MTRRLGGIKGRGLAAFASLSLAGMLAGGGAVVGCGSGDTQPTPPVEAGGGMDATGDNYVGNNDAGLDTSMVPDTSMPDTFVGDSPTMMEAAPTALMPPTFMPPDKTAVMIGSNVTITCAWPAGATNGIIFYTTDGTIPTHASKVARGGVPVSAAVTITAICSDIMDGYADSASAAASYTVITPEAGTLLPPTFSPAVGTQEFNDFTLTLADAVGTTICYTLDGVTTPTCDGTTGMCTGNSKQYNGTTAIPVNGGVTNPTTGSITVEAIACQVGMGTSSVATGAFTLTAGTPAISGPPATPAAMTNLPYLSTGYAPTVLSATTGAGIVYTNDGTTTPTCGVNGGTTTTNGASWPSQRPSPTRRSRARRATPPGRPRRPGTRSR